VFPIKPEAFTRLNQFRQLSEGQLLFDYLIGIALISIKVELGGQPKLARLFAVNTKQYNLDVAQLPTTGSVTPVSHPVIPDHKNRLGVNVLFLSQ
jgi:hypothetical protein